MRRSLFCLLIGLLFFGSVSAWAKAPDEPRAILQKLAQVELKDMVSKDKISVKVPSNWTTRDGSRGGIAFTDPQFDAIVGGVYRVDGVLTQQALVEEMNQLFFTQFEAESDGSMGVSAELRGRVSGEVTRVLAASVAVGDGKSVVFFAAAPENWFKSYKPVFKDMMFSVH